MKPLLIAMICVYASAASAALDRETTQPLAIPVTMAPDQITSKDVEQIISTDMKPTNNANAVASRLADRGLQAWLNSPNVKESALGQTTDNLQHKMSADLVLQSDEPEAVSHKFSMQVLALQAMARVQYSGWVNAVFNYDARAAQSMIEFSEKVFNDKNLFLNHTPNSKEDVSSVGIKWGW